MNFFKELKRKRAIKELKNSTITPKGICFREYCRKIMTGEWTKRDYIEAYEEELAAIRNLVEQGNHVISREETAELACSVLLLPREEQI